MKVLNIKTADSQHFKVEIDVLQQSQTFRTMLDDLKIGEVEDTEIPISEVTGEVFKKALVWMEKNRGKLFCHRRFVRPRRVFNKKARGCVRNLCFLYLHFYSHE